MLNFGGFNNSFCSTFRLPMWGNFNWQFPQFSGWQPQVPVQMPFFNFFQQPSYFMPQQINFNTGLFNSSYSAYNSGFVSPSVYPNISSTPLFNFNNSSYNFLSPNLNTNKLADNIALLNKNTESGDINAKDKNVKNDNFKPKVSSSDLSISSLSIIKEEVEPGYSVHKGRYINIKDLKPDMKNTLVKLDKKAKELGYTMVVIDGFRSHATQAAAYRRKPNLCARAGKSAHEYGAAVDLALYDKNGKQISIDRVPEFGKYAQSLNLVWGATWSNKKEPWHFNFVNWQNRADISAEYKKWNNLA